MKVFIFILHIICIDYDTGNTLWEMNAPYYGTFQDCQKVGLEIALPVSDLFRRTYSNASTNVNCQYSESAHF